MGRNLGPRRFSGQGRRARSTRGRRTTTICGLTVSRGVAPINRGLKDAGHGTSTVGCRFIKAPSAFALPKDWCRVTVFRPASCSFNSRGRRS